MARKHTLPACGLITGTLLAGRKLVVHQVREAKNILAAEEDRFEVDPATRIQVEKECRRSNPLTIFTLTPINQQSHQRQTFWAYEPNLIWVIAGVGDGVTSEIKAYRLKRDCNTFVEIDLIVHKARPDD